MHYDLWSLNGNAFHIFMSSVCRATDFMKVTLCSFRREWEFMGGGSVITFGFSSRWDRHVNALK